MTKYIGVIILWIIVAGIVLYVARNMEAIFSGLFSLIEGGNINELLQNGVMTFFK